jgi:DNA-binding NarL/FixJ family response regulator
MNKSVVSEPIRVLIVDDHELTRNGLLFGFKTAQAPLDVVGQAGNGQEALQLAQKHQPDLVLMDISMPVMDGIDATRAVKAACPQIKVIILTSRHDENEIYAALAAGADAYTMKDVTTDRLLQIIEMVLDGGFWLDPAIAALVLDSLRLKLPQTAKQGPNRQSYRVLLTEREKEVLALIVDSKNNREIAEILKVSIHTAKAHVANIIQKLAVDDRTEAAVKALREGWVTKQPHHQIDE